MIVSNCSKFSLGFAKLYRFIVMNGNLSTNFTLFTASTLLLIKLCGRVLFPFHPSTELLIKLKLWSEILTSSTPLSLLSTWLVLWYPLLAYCVEEFKLPFVLEQS